jgi:hypothetical protein
MTEVCIAPALGATFPPVLCVLLLPPMGWLLFSQSRACNVDVCVLFGPRAATASRCGSGSTTGVMYAW